MAVALTEKERQARGRRLRRVFLLIKLEELARSKDSEAAHHTADEALLEYIDDPEITAAFAAIEKWYS